MTFTTETETTQIATIVTEVHFDNRDPVQVTITVDLEDWVRDRYELEGMIESQMVDDGDSYGEDDSIIDEFRVIGGNICDVIELDSELSLDGISDVFAAFEDYGMNETLEYLATQYENDITYFSFLNIRNDFVGRYSSDADFLADYGIEDECLIAGSEFAESYFSVDSPLAGEVLVFHIGG